MPEPKIPFRLRVLMALSDCLKTITPANGYQFDLSDEQINDNGETGTRPRVVRGRDLFGDTDPLPMVAILELNEALDQQTSQGDNPVIDGPWDILIQGFVQDDKNNPTDPAHILMGEVKDVLGKEKYRTKPGSRQPDYLGLGDRKVNSITGFAVGPGSVRPPDDLSAKAFFYLVLSLKITENTTKPYD